MYRDMDYLTMAGSYAKKHTGCTKVAVGSLITNDKLLVAVGANRAIPDLCKTTRGCLRVEKYGDNAKTHRNPDDCRAIHSEIDAICTAAANGESVSGGTIYVTRYPCEACARAIVAAGIKTVVFGRSQDISEQTKEIFDTAGVTYRKCEAYQEDDTVI